jgi:Xaa-Pro aminopeptidase
VSNGRLRFFGTSGQAIVTENAAFLITDSRYWLQAKAQLDRNWTLVRAGAAGEPKDWIEWLVVCCYIFHD